MSEREVGKQVETERRTLFHMGNKLEALEYQVEIDLSKDVSYLGEGSKTTSWWATKTLQAAYSSCVP